MRFVLCSEEDVTDFICENKNKNTQTKTKGDVALFTRFLLGVGEELPPEQLRPELLDKYFVPYDVFLFMDMKYPNSYPIVIV